MPTFVEMNCVELLAGSRVEVSSYSRNSVLIVELWETFALIPTLQCVVV